MERQRDARWRSGSRLAAIAGLVLVAMLALGGAMGVPAASAAPERWRFAIYDPTLESILGRVWTGFAKAVAERTGGRLVIEVYPSGALGYSGFTHHQVVGEGLLEMGEGVTAGALNIGPFAVFAHMMLFEDEVQAGAAWDASRDLLEQAAARINAKPVAAFPRPPYTIKCSGSSATSGSRLLRRQRSAASWSHPFVFSEVPVGAWSGKVRSIIARSLRSIEVGERP